MAVDLIARGMAASDQGGGGGGAASGVSYDNSTSGLNSTNVQGAIDELAESRAKNGSITLSMSWSGTGPYSQEVTVSGATVTGNSQISLQPTPEQIQALIEDGITALLIENDGGTLTAYAVGGTTSAAETIACTVTEVAA